MGSFVLCVIALGRISAKQPPFPMLKILHLTRAEVGEVEVGFGSASPVVPFQGEGDIEGRWGRFPVKHAEANAIGHGASLSECTFEVPLPNLSRGAGKLDAVDGKDRRGTAHAKGPHGIEGME